MLQKILYRFENDSDFTKKYINISEEIRARESERREISHDIFNGNIDFLHKMK